jgi:hypothetical protein
MAQQEEERQALLSPKAGGLADSVSFNSSGMINQSTEEDLEEMDSLLQP